MSNVILISTEHNESGKCNSDELLKIVEAINPEVIFEEEFDDDKYHSFYNNKNSFKSLEIKTIIKCKLNYNIINTPVDKSINEYVSLYVLDILTKYFNQFQEYKRLKNEHCTLRDIDGFKYLNSRKCSDLFERMKLIEMQLISNSGSVKKDLINFYNLFHQEIDARENAMIGNICNFRKSNNFKKAIFFLGYAHRESFKSKVLETELLKETDINWTFYNE